MCACVYLGMSRKGCQVAFQCAAVSQSAGRAVECTSLLTAGARAPRHFAGAKNREQRRPPGRVRKLRRRLRRNGGGIFTGRASANVFGETYTPVCMGGVRAKCVCVAHRWQDVYQARSSGVRLR